MRRVIRRAVGAGLAAAAAGCSSGIYKIVPVTGTVTTCDGKPAEGGTVYFVPVDAPDRTGRPPGLAGGGSSGVVGPDGRFALEATDGQGGPGALVGPHAVTFRPPRTERPKLSAAERQGLPDDAARKIDEENAKLPVFPKIPCSDKIAPAEVEVKAGTNTFEFKLLPK